MARATRPPLPPSELVDSAQSSPSAAAPKPARTRRGDATPRRTGEKRVRGRSARVVSSVLTVAIEEIGRVGYEALRIDEVARRSGVNKTTVYRRWPTKCLLVTAAVEQMAQRPLSPLSGELRADLVAAASTLTHLVTTPFGKGLLRLFNLETTDPTLEAAAASYRATRTQKWNDIVHSAIRRGDLPDGIDVDLIVELIVAPVMVRLTMRNMPVDPEFTGRVIDVVIAGMKHLGGDAAPLISPADGPPGGTDPIEAIAAIPKNRRPPMGLSEPSRLTSPRDRP